MNNHYSLNPKLNILVVDDTPENLRLLSRILTREGYHVQGVERGSTALKIIQAQPPDLILLDIKIPDISGYEICQRLKENPVTQEIPVIFISVLDDVVDKVKALNMGGIDYISKPFHIAEVLARIKNQFNLIEAKAEIRQLNAELEGRVRQRTIQLETEITQHKRTQRQLKASNRELEQEVKERQRVQRKLLHMAWHDTLTNLPNRALLMSTLSEAIDRVQQDKNYQFALLFLDFDHFKVVNDSLGHLVGDELLVAVAFRLRSCLNSQQTLARLGGDEFTILAEEVEDVSDVTRIADSILEQFHYPFCLRNTYEIFINTSIGIVMGTKDYEHPEQVLRDADAAMYAAKDAGKACYKIFDQTMHTRALIRLQLETDLRLAVEHQDFVLHYQPIVSLKTGKLLGFEALLRWNHPTKGLIYPDYFIPIAEETGLIIPIGSWVFKEACEQIKSWKSKVCQLDKNTSKSRLKLSLNLSVKQFLQPNLVSDFQEIMKIYNVNGKSLKLEITESSIMKNVEEVVQILQEFRALKIQLSIDDFGKGYSSLSYLQKLPIDTLKIDRSFVENMDKNTDNLQIVQTIITLAHNLGVGAIAEGIETKQQLSQLRTLGCEWGQGNLFSKPLNSTQAGQLIARNYCWYSSSVSQE
ncbi:MAG: EAL domain-containing protein [Microcoleaceae cyanobacterium]